MIAFRMVIGTATVWPDPGARNSNRLPVNANGRVRWRRPGAGGGTGRVSTPMIMVPVPLDDVAAPLAICSKTSASWSPRKIEIMAGGALLAARRGGLGAGGRAR